MNDENWNRKQTLYQESWNFIRQQESLLFQRVNYFLVAIAFLVAGIVDLAVNSIQHRANPLLIGLVVLVGSTGLLISWIFTAMDYFDAQILTASYRLIQVREKELMDETAKASEIGLPYAQILQTMKKGSGEFNPKTFLFDSIVAPFKFIFGKKEPLAPHTWFLPFFFILFWLAALSIYCGFKFNWWTILLIIGIPISLVVMTGVGSYF